MVRIGLIGAGTMGQWYAECLTEYENCELVAICDLHRQRAAALADKWSVATVCDDVKEMLEVETLDAVVVATPDEHHHGPVVAALETGCHVLCEKPLGTTLEDGLAMREAARSSGKELMVNFGNRWRPRAQALRQAVRDQQVAGEIGNIYIELNERISKTDQLSWAGKSSPIWFLLSLCVDYVRFVTGLEIVEVFGYETRKHLLGQGCATSDTAIFVGRLSNDGHIFVGSSWTYPDEYTPDIDFSMRILGDKGFVEAQMHPHDVLVYTDQPRTVNYQYPYQDHRGRRENWWFQSTRYFVHCLESGQHPTPDVEDGLRCLQVLLAMEQTIQSEQPVQIPFDI